MCSNLLPCFYLYCGLLVTTLSDSSRVEAGAMAGVELLVAAALLYKVYQARGVGTPGEPDRWHAATGWWIALLWICALACSRHPVSMLLLLALSAWLADALTLKRCRQIALLWLALELLRAIANDHAPEWLWRLPQVVLIQSFGELDTQYQRHLADLALVRAASWGPALGRVRPVPQTHGEYALVWLVVRVGWMPVAGLVAGWMGLWTAGLLGGLRQISRTSRGCADHALARVWLVTGVWLMVQALLALAVNLAVLGQPVGMGWPGLSWHPVSIMMLLVWCGCAWHFASSNWNRPGAAAT